MESYEDKQPMDADSETEAVPNKENKPNKKKAEVDKDSCKHLGKRAGKSRPIDSEQGLKKKKLEEGWEKPAKSPKKPKSKKAQEDPSSSKAKNPKEEKTSAKASTSQNCVTPEGRQPPRLPFKTPARPKPTSRLIKDEPTKESQQKKQSKAKKGKGKK